MTYTVIYKETIDPSISGWNNFLSQLAHAYNISVDQAREWVGRSDGRLLQTADLGEAEAMIGKFRSLGAVVELDTDESAAGFADVATDPNPTPPPPAGSACHHCGAPAAPGQWYCPTCQAAAGASAGGYGAVTDNDKLLALVAYLSTFATYVFPFANFVVPVVLMYAKKGQSPFVEYHAKESLNFQISIFAYLFISSILTIFLIGIIPLIGFAIYSVVMAIVAGVKAYNGEYYQVPFIFRIIN